MRLVNCNRLIKRLRNIIIGDDNIEIIVDTREPKNNYNFLKGVFTNHTFKLKALSEGDYMCGNVLIERKTVADLYSSIMTGRLDTQLARMTTHSDKLIIIMITGNIQDYVYNMNDMDVGVNVDIIYGYIASVLCRENIIVFWFDDDMNAMLSMVKIMEKINEGDYRVPKRVDTDSLMAKYLGINIHQYRQLVSKCGSVLGIANADEKVIRSVKGIGNKKYNKIKDMLCGYTC
jgi:ERCC4-type nuclease